MEFNKCYNINDIRIIEYKKVFEKGKNMAVKKTADMAEYLFHEGTNFNAYEYMGVHKTTKGKKSGFVFRTWAPNAAQVFLAGDFNNWSKSNPMEKVSGQGVWEAFLPEDVFGDGSKYKFIIN